MPHKKVALWLMTALLLGGVAGYCANGLKDTENPLSSKSVELYSTMRKLWADHVIWTREYIVSAIDNADDTNFAAERLMRNQEDIGAAIVPFYGEEAGAELTRLLKEHISIAVELIDAAKTNNQAGYHEADHRWTQNAQDIAVFLSKANPHWPEQALVETMNMHLKTTTDEAVARLNKDYVKDIEAFDMVFHHIMEMSDQIAAGVIKQFPEKF